MNDASFYNLETDKRSAERLAKEARPKNYSHSGSSLIYQIDFRGVLCDYSRTFIAATYRCQVSQTNASFNSRSLGTRLSLWWQWLGKCTLLLCPVSELDDRRTDRYMGEWVCDWCTAMVKYSLSFRQVRANHDASPWLGGRCSLTCQWWSSASDH